MPHRHLFLWLVLVGAGCSLTGIARALSTPAPELTTVASRASAGEAAAGVATANAAPIVTEVPPVAMQPTPRSDVAMLVATPTPSTAVARAATPSATPETTVATLPASTAPSRPGPSQDAAKAAALLDLMNGARLQHGLPALERAADLDAVALARAENLVANDYFDHYSPDGESAFSELSARAIRYRLAGENLARNNFIDSETVGAAFDALMASDGHRANILEPRFSSVGVVAVLNGHMWIYVTVFTN